MENSPERPRLPVWDTIKESFAFPFTHLGALVRLGWPAALIAGGMTYLLEPFSRIRLLNGASPSVRWWPIVVSVAGILVIVSWSIAWMRLVLRIPESEVKLRFGWREWKYLGIMYGFAIGGSLLVMLSVALLVFSAALIGIQLRSWFVYVIFGVESLLYLGFAIIWTRIVLFGPAISVDRYRGLRVAWRETGGSFWRIVAIFLATLTPSWLLWWFSFEILTRVFMGRLFQAVFIAIIAVPCSAFLHTAWALIYGRLAPEKPPALAAAQGG